MADMLPQGYDNTNHFWDEGEVPAVSGTIEVGEVHTVTKEPGEDADVAINNIGSDTAAVLNFVFGIPKGETGERGSQGPVGPQGQEGPQGERGPAGPQGEKGEKGDKGDTGETGPQGPQGIQGPKGDTGDTGAQGPQGIQGETGPQGPVGPAGPQGPAGADGTDGTDGTDGVTPVISATATVGANTGTPSCTVTKTGTDAAPSFAFAFDGIKGTDGQSSAYTQSHTYDLTFNPPTRGGQSYSFSATDFTVADLAGAKMMILSIIEEGYFSIAIPMPQDSSKTALVRNIFSGLGAITLRDSDGDGVTYYPSAGGSVLSFYVQNDRNSSPYIDIKVSIFT